MIEFIKRSHQRKVFEFKVRRFRPVTLGLFQRTEDYTSFVDIAGTSVEQCENRYKEMIDRTEKERFQQKLFKSEFITADCTKVWSLLRYYVFNGTKC